MAEERPVFIECGCCNCYHPAEFYGDCRDDANRFAGGDLDERYGLDGWAEITIEEQEREEEGS